VFSEAVANDSLIPFHPLPDAVFSIWNRLSRREGTPSLRPLLLLLVCPSTTSPAWRAKTTTLQAHERGCQ
jgi:hypothetical protein